jgi:hypothetical protein
MSNFKYDIFISYNSAQKKEVEQINRIFKSILVNYFLCDKFLIKIQFF